MRRKILIILMLNLMIILLITACKSNSTNTAMQSNNEGDFIEINALAAPIMSDLGHCNMCYIEEGEKDGIWFASVGDAAYADRYYKLDDYKK